MSIEHTYTTEALIDILHKKVGMPTSIAEIEKKPWDELGVDSLGITEVCSYVERTLALHIPYDQAIRTQNIEELVSLLNTLSTKEIC